jgi:hypothetical protein
MTALVERKKYDRKYASRKTRKSGARRDMGGSLTAVVRHRGPCGGRGWASPLI